MAGFLADFLPICQCSSTIQQPTQTSGLSRLSAIVVDVLSSINWRLDVAKQNNPGSLPTCLAPKQRSRAIRTKSRRSWGKRIATRATKPFGCFSNGCIWPNDEEGNPAIGWDLGSHDFHAPFNFFCKFYHVRNLSRSSAPSRASQRWCKRSRCSGTISSSPTFTLALF